MGRRWTRSMVTRSMDESTEHGAMKDGGSTPYRGHASPLFSSSFFVSSSFSFSFSVAALYASPSARSTAQGR